MRMVAAAFKAEKYIESAVQLKHAPVLLKYPEEIFRNNDAEAPARDFKLLTAGRTSALISSTNTIIGNDFFAEKKAPLPIARLLVPLTAPSISLIMPKYGRAHTSAVHLPFVSTRR